MFGRGDELSPKGLLELINFPMEAPEGDMFGDEDDDYDPEVRVFIMTPRQRRERLDDNFNYLFSDEAVRGETDNPIAWPTEVGLLRRAIQNVFGEGVPIEEVLYSPMELDNDLTFRLTMEALDPELQGTLVTEEEQAEIPKKLGDDDQEMPRGKLLVQYHPAKTCQDEAEWRVWFEGRPLDGRTASWIPEPGRDQYFTRDGEQGQPQKRDECILSTSSTVASTATDKTETESASSTGADTPASTTGSGEETTSFEEMPTLTRDPVSVTTPSGSSCAETGTITNCIEAACEEHPTCVSWVPVETTTEEPITTEEPEPTTTEEPEPATTTAEEPEPTETEHPPLELKPVACESADDYPGHADISWLDQELAAGYFCANVQRQRETMGPSDETIEESFSMSSNINYWYSVSWIEDCDRTDVVQQDLMNPLGDSHTCKEILEKCYSDCKSRVLTQWFWDSFTNLSQVTTMKALVDISMLAVFATISLVGNKRFQ